MEDKENLKLLCKSSEPFLIFHYLDLISLGCPINECLWKTVKLIWNRFEKVLAPVFGTIFALAIRPDTLCH